MSCRTRQLNLLDVELQLHDRCTTPFGTGRLMQFTGFNFCWVRLETGRLRPVWLKDCDKLIVDLNPSCHEGPTD